MKQPKRNPFEGKAYGEAFNMNANTVGLALYDEKGAPIMYGGVSVCIAVKKTYLSSLMKGEIRNFKCGFSNPSFATNNNTEVAKTDDEI